MVPDSRSKMPGKASVLAFALVAFAVLAAPSVRAAAPSAYVVTPLASDVAMPGVTRDANLLNGWGLAAGPSTPWWVADNGANLSTLYFANGTKLALEVKVTSAPTGVVFNGFGTSFMVAGGNQPARFIFATERGTILGWGNLLGRVAEVKVNSTAAGAIYKGLAIAQTDSGPQLYATDFHNGRVDVFNATWGPVTVPGGFADPSLPAGFAPFGIQAFGSDIVVTFAKQGPGTDELHGQGLGVVDMFDTAGNLLARIATRGQLNAPWGLAWAPDNFGTFSGDLLVGNFGDGHINAYALQEDGTFAYRGMLRTNPGAPVTIDGLWALQFGHGALNNGPTKTLFFTAGPNDEADGLFGSITTG